MKFLFKTGKSLRLFPVLTGYHNKACIDSPWKPITAHNFIIFSGHASSCLLVIMKLAMKYVFSKPPKYRQVTNITSGDLFV